MGKHELIEVALDYELVERLLKGLYRGASGKALKVIISTAGSYHIESRELKMVIEIDSTGKNMNSICIHNEKLSAYVSAYDLEQMKLTGLAKNVVEELKAKYSPVFHSLADNIIVFSRAYANNI